MPEHLDARTTISKGMFYYISADQNFPVTKKIKTSLPAIEIFCGYSSIARFIFLVTPVFSVELSAVRKVTA